MFSKLFVLCIGSLTLLISIFACIMVAITGVMNTLDVLITAVFAQMSIIGGFYFHKSKRENEIKLGSLYHEDEVFNDGVAADTENQAVDYPPDIEDGRG